jgi:hypothetical protein
MPGKDWAMAGVVIAAQIAAAEVITSVVRSMLRF